MGKEYDYVLRKDADGNDAIELGKFERWDEAAEEALKQLGWTLLSREIPKKEGGEE